MTQIKTLEGCVYVVVGVVHCSSDFVGHHASFSATFREALAPGPYGRFQAHGRLRCQCGRWTRFEAQRRLKLHLEAIPEQNRVPRDGKFPLSHASTSAQRCGGAAHLNPEAGALRVWRGCARNRTNSPIPTKNVSSCRSTGTRYKNRSVPSRTKRLLKKVTSPL